ncbi:MAG TPA: PIN domain-containing protein [Stellaceae bacterium]|nr:PIN domain-containing protein [Stellaceae bacterium]
MISLDTNILIYSVDRAAGDRHETAANLVERSVRAQNCVQPLQSLCEFFNVATRKIGLDAAAAAEVVARWEAAVPVEPASGDDLRNAIRAVREHGLSFWDALLWATVRRVGVDLLLSEDLQDRRTIEGVRILNPFAVRNARLIETAIAR